MEWPVWMSIDVFTFVLVNDCHCYKGQIYVRAILKLVKLGCGDFKVLIMFQDTVFIRHNLNTFTCKLGFLCHSFYVCPIVIGKNPAWAFIVFWLPQPPTLCSFLHLQAAELTENTCVFKTLQWILTVFRIKSKILNRTQKAGMIWPLAALTGAFLLL